MLQIVEAAPAKSSHNSEDYEKRLAALVSQVANGDHAALAELYDQTSRVVFSLAYRIIGDRSGAEEITLDVFTYVWRQASRYSPERGAPSAWLLMLTHSRSIDYIRTRARQGFVIDIVDTDQADGSPDPEENAIVAGRREKVQAALAALPQGEREAIEFAYYLGLSQSEIAERTGVPLGTVKSRIRVGMTRLRSLLRVFEGAYVG